MKKSDSYIPNVIFCLFFIILTVIFSSTSLAKETITWIYVDYPPFGIREGPDKDKGMLDIVINYMQERLVEYKHKKQIGNVKRVILILESEEGIACTCGLNKTPERQKNFYFSIPALICPGVGITTRKELLSSIGGTEMVSLEELLKNKNLKLGIPAERSFGEKIDPMIRNYLNAENVYSQSLGNINKSLMGMLVCKRIDYMLARPYEAMYIAKEMDEEDKIVNIPLKEAEDYLISYIVCNRNEQGRQVIEKINYIIEKERGTEKYRSLMETWLDENYLKEFRKLYKDIF